MMMNDSYEARACIAQDTSAGCSRERGAQADEAGAILLLALFFTVIAGLIVTTLVTFTGNDITNLGNFRTARSETYAADAAVQAAIYNVRYSYEAGNTGTFCGGSQDQPPSNPFTIDKVEIYVWCSLGGASINRVSTFSAYPAAQCTGNCLTGSQAPTGHPYLTAQVAFVDLDNHGNFNCSTTTTASCGFGMNILSWVVQPGAT